MQAIIMAAGKGSRLGKLTENMPKSFLEIRGKKLIDINLSMLHKYGIWDIKIITGFQDKKFIDALQRIPGVTLIFNPFYEFTNVLGSYYMGMKYLHDDFIYMHADTLCSTEIFCELLSAEGDIILPIDAKPCDDEAMKVRLHNGKITEITKKMPPELSDGEFIGIAKIKKNVIDDLNLSAVKILRDRDFTSYFEGALQKVFDMNKYDVRMIKTNGRFWAEVDFLEDYQKAAKNIDEELLKF